ncbi:MAG: phospholipase effector Tle1 domain-containing protein, partial [Planctomycetota bacterium]
LADRKAAGQATSSIRFLGLFDQIGATGTPVYTGGDQYLRQQLPAGIRIEHCAAAYAWDEARLQLQCIWQPRTPAGLDVGHLEQEIFRGTHGDVGGGYETTGLSDLVLRWFIEQATQAGLAFQPEEAWRVCDEALRVQPDASQLPHRVTDPHYFPKPRRFPDWLLRRAREEHGFPLGDWHRVLIKNRHTGREKYLMNLDPFIEDCPRPPGYRVVQPRDWFPKKPRPQARMRIDRRLSEEDILALMAEDSVILPA